MRINRYDNIIVWVDCIKRSIYRNMSFKFKKSEIKDVLNDIKLSGINPLKQNHEIIIIRDIENSLKKDSFGKLVVKIKTIL